MAEQEVGKAGAKGAPQEIKAIIPKKAAHEMRRLLEEGGDGEPLIGFTKNLMIFRKSGLLLTSRLMEGNYPNYQQVIPKESGKKIACKRTELESALRRVSVLSKDKANAVKLSFALRAYDAVLEQSGFWGSHRGDWPRNTKVRR